ncbi:hypothetical protein [Halodurantibacterium flavum]|uniref:GntR family transcriptional regulator n=1 Tax=Halodurantibacterium flavum TaxID=1382802 RepID=A0ABW4S9N8_9RHOB
MSDDIRTAYHTALAEIRNRLPGGVPLAEDREGILRRVASEHGLSIETAREIIVDAGVAP